MTRLQRLRVPEHGGAHPEFTTCLACGTPIPWGAGIADLDGPAFQAYYHQMCAPRVLCAIDGRTDHNTDSHDKVWGWER